MQKITVRKKRDFDNIFKNGKTVKGSFLILKFIPNNLDSDRHAFMVSKKVSVRAVIRNKIRRRLSESVRLLEKNSKDKKDVIFIAIPKIRGKNFTEIKTEVEILLKKIA
jgi:ribonuclease P protein component